MQFIANDWFISILFKSITYLCRWIEALRNNIWFDASFLTWMFMITFVKVQMNICRMNAEKKMWEKESKSEREI